MSLGIMSISADENGLYMLSYGLLISAALVFVGFSVLLLIYVTRGRKSEWCRNSIQCRYGLFTATAAFAILINRMFLGSQLTGYISMNAFILFMVTTIIVRPKFPMDFMNDHSRIDVSFTIYPIAILAVSVASTTTLSGYPIQVLTLLFALYGAVLFYIFEAKVLWALISGRTAILQYSGALFILMGFHALTSIFMFTAAEKVTQFLGMEVKFIFYTAGILFWIWSTILFPVVVYLYIANGRTPHFSTSKFSLVFPCGVYSVATLMVGSYLHLDLRPLSLAFLVICVLLLVRITVQFLKALSEVKLEKMNHA